MGRGQAPAKAIPMTSLQTTLLRQEGNKRTTQRQFSVRINSLFRANEGHSNSEIARDLALSLNTVKLWRGRWQSAYQQLCVYEESMQEQGELATFD